jgi:type VI protein secretion system component VasF
MRGFLRQTIVEAKMADRDVFGERIRRDRLPSGLRPIFGILLAVIVVAAWVFFAVIFQRDERTTTANLDSLSAQAPSQSAAPPNNH